MDLNRCAAVVTTTFHRVRKDVANALKALSQVHPLPLLSMDRHASGLSRTSTRPPGVIGHPTDSVRLPALGLPVSPNIETPSRQTEMVGGFLHEHGGAMARRESRLARHNPRNNSNSNSDDKLNFASSNSARNVASNLILSANSSPSGMSPMTVARLTRNKRRAKGQQSFREVGALTLSFSSCFEVDVV